MVTTLIGSSKSLCGCDVPTLLQSEKHRVTLLSFCKTSFKTAFLTELAKITYTVDDVERAWFVVGDYLYLGNAMTSAENGAFTYNGTITINNDMQQSEIQGCEVALTFEYQAIQKQGTSLSLTGYTLKNATAISQLTGWETAFPPPRA